ncbi:hypothetical protein C8A00DRAFT_30509 [Chaetomidium leptoderma]|uniref:Hydantoinase/oxoprolinase N-terminal domain-containing protein n=1 Tax=Chaetomidium leptoderma TaxID=669021 RepID=A0AAN7A090_9PEZI|nr:hypothetical protein C8A00DRAFT_30509 [Chaetomidium leptoderma]
MPPNNRHLRIGVDVGGTNTDGVLIDPLCKLADPSRGILAWTRSPDHARPG